MLGTPNDSGPAFHTMRQGGAASYYFAAGVLAKRSAAATKADNERVLADTAPCLGGSSVFGTGELTL